MIATSFPESNKVIDKPSDMTRDECDALSVFIGQDSNGFDVIISCWKPTKEELKEFNKTGRLWVYHYGTILQPHSASCHNPFIEREEDDTNC